MNNTFSNSALDVGLNMPVDIKTMSPDYELSLFNINSAENNIALHN